MQPNAPPFRKAGCRLENWQGKPTGFIRGVMTFLFIDIFDTAGTLIGLSAKAGCLDEKGELPRANQAFIADSTAISIANGISFGIVSYALLKLASGKLKGLHWILGVLAILLIARYIWLGE